MSFHSHLEERLVNWNVKNVSTSYIVHPHVLSPLQAIFLCSALPFLRACVCVVTPSASDAPVAITAVSQKPEEVSTEKHIDDTGNILHFNSPTYYLYYSIITSLKRDENARINIGRSIHRGRGGAVNGAYFKSLDQVTLMATASNSCWCYY